MFKNVCNIIHDIENVIYNYDMEELNKLFELMIKELIDKYSFFYDEQINILNFILNKINNSFENKDFILLCDVLIFELKPFLNEFENNEGRN